ncbi:ClpP/crotonase-like domain-containing protein [Parasitella parasitica]|nr:ClpP/crotonase-like domain-containing protein [Parasitella parasitica]
MSKNLEKSLNLHKPARKASKVSAVSVTEMNRSKLITFNRPKSLNAIDDKMIRVIYENLKAFGEQYDATDMIFIRGNDKVFSAGGNLQLFIDGMQNREKLSILNNAIDLSYKALIQLSMFEKPTISLLDGLAVGLGACFGCSANIKIVTENTLFGMPETTIGHFCDASSSYYFSRLKGYYGRYLTLCAALIKAEDLLHIGLATHYVPSKRLSAMTEHLASLDTPSLHEIQQEICKFTEELPAVGRLTSTPSISQHEKQSIIENCFKFDTVEEIVAALDTEGSQFSLACKSKILAGSPLAIKVTLELLRRASSLSLTECIFLESHLWKKDLSSYDFLEGCMSKINKRRPKWYPTQIQDLDLERDVIVPHFDQTASPDYAYLLCSDTALLEQKSKL